MYLCRSTKFLKKKLVEDISIRDCMITILVNNNPLKAHLEERTLTIIFEETVLRVCSKRQLLRVYMFL